MATANEQIRDALIRHQIAATRAARTLADDVVAIVNRAEQQLRARIEQRVGRIIDRGLGAGRDAAELLAALDREIAEILGEVYGDLLDMLQEFVERAAPAEAQHLRDLMQDLAPVLLLLLLPGVRALRRAVLDTPMQGRLVRDWVRDLEQADRARIMEQVNIGLVQGLPIGVILRSIFGTAKLRGADGVRQIARNIAATLGRTLLHHTLAQARAALIAANPDQIRLELYVAVLDSRTTPLCASLDGNRYRPGVGPIPPLHWNCRSMRVPVLDAGALSGMRPANSATRQDLQGLSDRERRRALRASIGQVPASQTYAEFLRNQTAAFQEEVLGRERARLFREGRFTLDRFVDQRTGRVYPLAELMGREPAAFRTA